MAERSSPEQGPEEMESAVSLLRVEEDREISVAGQSRWTRGRIMIGAAVGLAAAAALVVTLALRRGAAATEGTVGDATELWYDQDSMVANRPFDCAAGLSNWQDGWSDEKKTWCCDHTGRGCASRGVADQVYDCNTGFANWKVGWSSPKKKWCCHHVGRGCEFRHDDDFDIQASGWGNSPYQNVHGNTGATYNCNDGFANWRAGWSPEKKDWCCSHTGRGCNPGPYHEPSYHGGYQPVHDGHDYPIVHDVCLYHVGDDVSVQSHGGWHRARVLGHVGHETYSVMLERYGEEMTAPCSDIRSPGGAVYPAALWILLVISLVAIVIGLWATFVSPMFEGDQKWRPAVWTALFLVIIAAVAGLLVAFHK